MTLFFALSCSRNTYTYTPILKSKALSSSILNPKSKILYLDSLLENWEKNEKAYAIRKYNQNYSDSSYLFYLFQENNSTAIIIDDDKDKNIHIYKFLYPKDTWIEVDSLLAEFWDMPETIPQNAAIEDATEIELTGIKNGVRHKVVRTSPSIDPKFYKLVNIITIDLINAGSETIE